MDIVQSVILGLIQGVTEFLPVSSSGHLVLSSSIYKALTGQAIASGGSEEIFFDIMLHLSTLVAIIIYFRKDIKNIFQVFFKCVKNNTLKDNYEAQIPIYIAIGTTATVALAYPFKDHFEALVHNPSVVGLILILTGTILYATEFISDKIPKKTSKLTWKKAALIGLAQGCAIAPGLSRSGSTIAAGLATGLDRTTCAKYSFLLSIPIILLAAIFHSIKMIGVYEILTYNWIAISVGCLFAGISGYFCIKYFIMFINKNKLNVFAYYCWGVGLLMFISFGFFIK